MDKTVELIINSARKVYKFLVGISLKNFFKVVLYIVIILGIYTLFSIFNKDISLKNYTPVIKNITKEAVVDAAEDVDSVRVRNKMKEAILSDEVEDNLNDISYNILKALDADRCLISLFHNGKYTSGNIDFKYMDEGYEKVSKKRNISKITGYYRDPSKRYVDIPTRDLGIYRYLRENKDNFWAGSAKDLYKIDEDYSLRMKETDVGYKAMYFVHEDNLPLSIISVAWKENNLKYRPDSITIYKVLKEWAVEAKPYLYIYAYNKIYK